MGLKTDQILKILQLNRLGRKTAFDICELAKDHVIDHDADLADLLIEYIKGGRVKRLPLYSKDELKNAFAKGDQIIEMSSNSGITILSYYDENYPMKLKNIDDPPIILNFKGDYKSINKLIGVAIIGTRQPTTEGFTSGKHFGRQFGEKGYNVVSGLALGCDTSAHVGCLEANGFTTAILAHGLHTVYPKENASLVNEIVAKGSVLMSEYGYGVGALANYFVERDRLQAGLSDLTIVIQTTEKGGTMHAVRATLKSNKILAAVKYKPDLISEKIEGNEMLISQRNAFPLTSTNLDELIGMLVKVNTKPSESDKSSSVETKNKTETIEKINKESEETEKKTKEVENQNEEVQKNNSGDEERNVNEKNNEQKHSSLAKKTGRKIKKNKESSRQTKFDF